MSSLRRLFLIISLILRDYSSPGLLKIVAIEKSLDVLTKEFFLKGSLMIDHVMNDLLNLKIENYQKMILVEIAIGVINADRSIEQEEIDFVNRLIINLKIPSELISSRFGDWKSIDGNINSN